MLGQLQEQQNLWETNSYRFKTRGIRGDLRPWQKFEKGAHFDLQTTIVETKQWKMTINQNCIYFLRWLIIHIHVFINKQDANLQLFEQL